MTLLAFLLAVTGTGRSRSPPWAEPPGSGVDAPVGRGMRHAVPDDSRRCT